MSRLLKVTGIILIVFSGIALIAITLSIIALIGINAALAELTGDTSYNAISFISVITLILGLIDPVIMLMCGIYGVKGDYGRAEKFGKILLSLLLIDTGFALVGGVVLGQFNFMLILYLVITILYIYSTKAPSRHTEYQDPPQQESYTYTNPYRSQSYTPPPASSYEYKNGSNTGFMPLSGNMQDNFSGFNNQDDSRGNSPNIISSENVDGELSFEEFERMLNQPSKGKIS